MNLRFVLLLIPVTLAGLMFAQLAHAEAIDPVGPIMVAEPPPCAACARPYIKPCVKHKYHQKKPRHHIIRHHRKHYKRHCRYISGSAIPVCVYSYYPQAEIPAFRTGAGRGRFVNLIDCVPYDPDMSTGDD